jgi:hypothetical protein
MKKTLAVLGVAVTLSGTPAFAGPRDDSPRGPVDRIVERAVEALKHLLHLVPNDGLDVPRP